MSFEVEVKYHVESHDGMDEQLRDLGAVLQDCRQEHDLYFQHPGRSFVDTDEALRIRRTGDRLWFTYKGPKLDSETKTRLEIEPELVGGPDCFERAVRFLESLSFRKADEVIKQRSVYTFSWQGLHTEVCLDVVEGLGLFVELEVLAMSDQLDPARRAVLELANALGLHEQERRSYLALLFNQDNS